MKEPVSAFLEESQLDVMPVLLRDASACRNDLGRILYTNPSEWAVHMDIVSTNTMSSFFASHIEYQMSISVSTFFLDIILLNEKYLRVLN